MLEGTQPTATREYRTGYVNESCVRMRHVHVPFLVRSRDANDVAWIALRWYIVTLNVSFPVLSNVEKSRVYALLSRSVNGSENRQTILTAVPDKCSATLFAQMYFPTVVAATLLPAVLGRGAIRTTSREGQVVGIQVSKTRVSFTIYLHILHTPTEHSPVASA